MERIVCLGPSLNVTKPDSIARAVRADRIRAAASSAAPLESSLERDAPSSSAHRDPRVANGISKRLACIRPGGVWVSCGHRAGQDHRVAMVCHRLRCRHAHHRSETHPGGRGHRGGERPEDALVVPDAAAGRRAVGRPDARLATVRTGAAGPSALRMPTAAA
jgi:hypothetical protein